MSPLKAFTFTAIDPLSVVGFATVTVIEKRKDLAKASAEAFLLDNKRQDLIPNLMQSAEADVDEGEVVHSFLEELEPASPG